MKTKNRHALSALTRLNPSMACLLLVTTCFGQGSAPAKVASPRDLMTELIRSLNTKSPGRISGFLEDWGVPGGNLESRAAKWQSLAENGAPFEPGRVTKETADEVDEIVTDHVGTRLVFRMHYQAQPKLRFVGLQIGPAFRSEGGAGAVRTWGDLSNLATQILSTTHATGMAIVASENGKLTVGTSGLRSVGDSGAVQASDLWSVGAIGKSVCACVIGKLAEEHKLSWNTTLRQILPGVPMNAQYEKATIGQILHHRAGFPVDVPISDGRFALNDKGLKDARTRYLKSVLNSKPASTPGLKFKYSNAGYAALAAIAERLTGATYESLVRKYVFMPLGLKSSFVGFQHPAVRISGYREYADGLHPVDFDEANSPLTIGGGGCLTMTLGDLVRYGQAHLNGLKGKPGFLKPATVVALHQGEAIASSEKRQYACGWAVDELPNLPTMHGHNGSSAGHRLQLAIFPDQDLVVAAGVNLEGGVEPSPGLQAAMAVARRRGH